MILGVTIVGWGLIAIFWWPVVIFVTLAIWRRTERLTPARKSVLALFAAVLAVLPAADAMWIQWRFDQLCEGAGLNVPRKIVAEGYYLGIDGFDFDNKPINSESAQRYFDSTGWRVLERKLEFDRTGKIMRIEKIDGVWRKRILVKPEARYQYVRQIIRSGYQLGGVKEMVVDTTTGETVGSLLIYYGHSGIVDTLWLRFFDPAAIHQCPINVSFAVTDVLIPIDKR